MRDYAKILPTFWTGDTGKSIRAIGVDAQLLALYLLTNPHTNMFGLYYLPIPLMTHETGLSVRKIISILGQLQAIGWCRYEPTTEFIWVIEMAGYQIGDMNPDDNRMKGLRRAWQALTPNPFLGLFHEKYGMRWGLNIRASIALKGGVLSPQIIEQEQEQEQDQELDAGRASPPSLPKPVLERRTAPPFLKPLVEEIRAYCLERKNRVDPEKFFNHYESNGWRVGRNPMKDWKAAVRTWERSDFDNLPGGQPNGQNRTISGLDKLLNRALSKP